MQAACSTSRRTYSIKPTDYATGNKLPNEFYLYVLEDLHTGQSLGTIEFTST
jgi:hypothetical protein